MSDTLAHTPSVGFAPTRFSLSKLFKRALYSLQFGQMCSALGRLDDHQLAEIGIKRAQIPAYAHKQLASEV